jgi:hypothetical protein
MHRRSISLAPTLALVAVFILLLPAVIQAQSVKIVLPERFRVLSDQLFDLDRESSCHVVKGCTRRTMPLISPCSARAPNPT